MKMNRIMLAALLASASLAAFAQGGNSSSGTDAGTTNGSSSTNTTLSGHEGFNCATGSAYAMIKGIATCKALTPTTSSASAASCSAQTLSQGYCSFPFPATSSGSTPLVASTATGYTGTSSATCTNGTWGSLASTTTCLPAACAATIATSGSCSYPIPAINSGQSSTVATTTANYTGSDTATCNAGALSFSNPSCTLPTPCAAGTVTWSDPAAGTGATCSASVVATPVGSNVTLDYSGATALGRAQFTCTNSVWTYSAGGCFSLTACPASGSPTFNYLASQVGGAIWANTPPLPSGIPQTWGSCTAPAALSVPATAGSNAVVSSNLFPFEPLAPVVSANAGAVGSEALMCQRVIIQGPLSSGAQAVPGWSMSAKTPYTCGATACAAPPIGFITQQCGGSNYGSAIYAASTQCDATTSNVWKTWDWSEYYEQCSTTSTSIANFLGMAQVAVTGSTYYSSGVVNAALAKSYSSYSYTVAIGVSATPTISLVLNSSGAWTIAAQSVSSGVTTPSTVASGTWTSAPAKVYEYQILAGENIAAAAGITPSQTIFATPTAAWKTISGATTVASCTVPTGSTTCSAEWVVGVRLQGTTAPVVANAIRLTATN
jgi:hypothetical protein